MCDRISCTRKNGFIGFYASEKRCASSHIVEQCGLFLRRDVGVLICSRYDPVFACNQGGSVFMWLLATLSRRHHGSNKTSSNIEANGYWSSLFIFNLLVDFVTIQIHMLCVIEIEFQAHGSHCGLMWFDCFVFLQCCDFSVHPWVRSDIHASQPPNLSYRFPIFETYDTGLRGTTGTRGSFWAQPLI